MGENTKNIKCTCPECGYQFIKEVAVEEKAVEVMEQVGSTNGVDVVPKKKVVKKTTNKNSLVDMEEALRLLQEHDSDPRIDNLENNLNMKVQGQGHVIKDVVKLIKSRWYMKKASKKPVSYIFIGSSGTGKTFLANEIAEQLKLPYELIAMNEYADASTASNLFGSAVGVMGSERRGKIASIFNRFETAGGGVLVLDEIEKAYKEIFQRMLNVLDSGEVTDAHGKAKAPKNTFIIMTSNLAQDQLIDAMEKYEGLDDVDSMKKATDEAKQIIIDTNFFSREFLGRVNRILCFKPMSQRILMTLIPALILKEAENYEITITSIEPMSLVHLIKKSGATGNSGVRGVKDYINAHIQENLLDLSTEMIRSAKIVKIGDEIRAIED